MLPARFDIRLITGAHEGARDALVIIKRDLKACLPIDTARTLIMLALDFFRLDKCPCVAQKHNNNMVINLSTNVWCIVKNNSINNPIVMNFLC